ncbi:DUF6122 family protein [Aquimarina sp. W85]|uniref:DUF6122 family protein n=1 Tax=Aquimarina rhodophyticola TaxID=3342246 RepID=UPI00366FAE72
MTRTLIHYSFHFIIPLIISVYWYRKEWKQLYIYFILAMLIDIDHLWAHPIFDPNRCSVGFHTLHDTIPIIIYCLLLIPKKSRIIGAALLWHIVTDSIDCWLMHELI